MKKALKKNQGFFLLYKINCPLIDQGRCLCYDLIRKLKTVFEFSIMFYFNRGGL